jgi:hypothetical protein
VLYGQHDATGYENQREEPVQACTSHTRSVIRAPGRLLHCRVGLIGAA